MNEMLNKGNSEGFLFLALLQDRLKLMGIHHVVYSINGED